MIRTVLGAVVTCSVLAGSAMAADVCQNKRHLTSYFVRQLQTDLMVASLSCNAKDQYNAFVTRFNETLVANGKTLKETFKKRYGGEATAELNDYVTMLANLSSIDSLSAGAKYCVEQKQAFARVMAVSPGGLERFALEWWENSRNIPESDCRVVADLSSLQIAAQ